MMAVLEAGARQEDHLYVQNWEDPVSLPHLRGKRLEVMEAIFQRQAIGQPLEQPQRLRPRLTSSAEPLNQMYQ